ncbi:helicase [Seminavis robusta]|uniref:Helicase n=1 Tax=Seminavis robusta TaxID=568900 RepID=A0A9N8DHR6_9STRA|nr:helicase [Seminavis robusta]|eukprot:Sro128_g061020.1 helicase (283) ;mRNA; r:5813-6661
MSRPQGDEAWDAMLEELKEFQEKKGHCRVPATNGKLGNWVSAQRKWYKKGKLNEERFQKPQGLGFTWVVYDYSGPLGGDWLAMFANLKKFQEDNGHCRVPGADGKLGAWVFTQRKRHKQGKLTKERFQKLQEMGFTWDVHASFDPLGEDWLAMFANLKKFQEENGHSRVPRAHEKLGSWVCFQRKLYNQGKLNKARFQKLQELGFTWVLRDSSDPLGEDWLAMFANLKKFQEGNGHSRVSTGDGKLGNWVSTQRKSFNQGKLTKEISEARRAWFHLGCTCLV